MQTGPRIRTTGADLPEAGAATPARAVLAWDVPDAVLDRMDGSP
ncbi:hypothetical protein [Ralstonia solanacearum]